MVQPIELTSWCDTLLDARSFEDYCPNGLQVEGTRPVRKLATGVTACLDLIEAAADWGADALLVHHGYFWRGEPAALTGMKGRRIRQLFAHDISLLAYHLPLDAHASLGNNAQLAIRLGLAQPVAPAGPGLLWRTELDPALTPEELGQRIGDALGREPLHIPGGPGRIRRVGWCTGGAQGFIDEAASAGLDAYISGEISEPTVHVARERGIHYFAAGHHATERYGVQALGEKIAQEFQVAHRFFEIDNPV